MTAALFWYNKWYKIDHSSLLSQGMFWGALTIPSLSFFYFGHYAWQGYALSLNADGLNEFISISKLPLGLLSLSIPLVAIVASVHRSIQTEEQISSALNQLSLAKKKNSLDEYYAREKNFLDKCSFVEKRTGSLRIVKANGFVEHKVSLSAPHKLFKTIYSDSRPDRISIFEASDILYQQISLEAITINENIKHHMDRVEAGDIPSIDDDAAILFVVTRSICKTFDLLHVDLFPVPYFMIQKAKGRIQLCLTSEEDLKHWLRKYILLIDSFVGSVWPEKKHDIFNIRRYLFLGAHYFKSFEVGNVVQDYDSLNWEGTVNAFK